MTGDASTMNIELFMEVHRTMEGNEALSMEDIGNRAARRLNDSIATNPNFYYGPYTGFVARNAGYAFAGRLLSNHSAEYPRGGHLSACSLPTFLRLRYILTSPFSQGSIPEFLGRIREQPRET